MRVLVFGQTGQVAHALARRLPPGVTAQFLGRDRADLARPDAIAAAVAAFNGDAVINAAAWTAVDRAETEETAACLVNAASPTAMAQAAAAKGLPLVHISTDYVFDGAGDQPFHPEAPIAPLGAYGRSKAAGEAGVRAAGGTHAILRTSWVFSAHGANFLKTMLRLSQTRDRLGVVADQIGGPTPADAIADACLTIAARLCARPALSGTYHFAGTPDVSWADFARAIFATAGRSTLVDDIATAAYPTPARRPANSRLECSLTTSAFGIPRPDWRAALPGILTELETQP